MSEKRESVASGVFWGLVSFFILLPLGIFVIIFILGVFLRDAPAPAKPKEATQEETDRYFAQVAEKTEAERIAKIKGREAEEKRQEEERKRLEAEQNEKWRLEAVVRAEKEQRKIDAENAKKAALTARIVANQLKQASNGSPTFQLELGKRYMSGDGVETNLALARHWLQSACTNHESAASNLLERLLKSGGK